MRVMIRPTVHRSLHIVSYLELVGQSLYEGTALASMFANVSIIILASYRRIVPFDS